MTDKIKIAKQLDDLIKEGQGVFYVLSLEYNKSVSKNKSDVAQKLLNDVAKKMAPPSKDYQIWYDKAYRVVRTFNLERLEEFEKLYTGDKSVKNSEYLDSITIGVLHYFKGITKTPGIKQPIFFETVLTCLAMQISILMAMSENFDNNLFNLETNIYLGVYESEIDIAEELQKKEYFRAAGVIAGAVLEVHLKIVTTNRGIIMKKEKPTMSDYNSVLKSRGVVDKAMSSLIQTCTHIRNKCAHTNEEEPTNTDINIIIRDTKMIIVGVK